MNNDDRSTPWMERNIGWIILAAIALLVFGLGSMKL